MERESTRLRNRAFRRQGGRCHYCSISMTRGDHPQINTTCTAEHLVPLALGGTNDERNIVAACNKCNTERGRLLYDELYEGALSLATPSAPENTVFAARLTEALTRLSESAE